MYCRNKAISQSQKFRKATTIKDESLYRSSIDKFAAKASKRKSNCSVPLLEPTVKRERKYSWKYPLIHCGPNSKTKESQTAEVAAIVTLCWI